MKMNNPFVVLTLVMAFSLAYMFLFAKRGWIPQDEGVLGQQAVRWLAGELPHKDFHETYSGGLTVLNGLAFSWFGINSLSLRYLLLIVGLVCLSTLFFIFRDVLSPWKTALMTLVAMVWSFPNYFAGLPSWYVTTCWCLGYFCLTKHQRPSVREANPLVSHDGWLFLSGIFFGLSILIKINGIFFVSVPVLALCHLVILRSDFSGKVVHISYVGSVLVSLVVFGFLGFVFWIFRFLPTPGVFYFLFVPNAFASLYLLFLIIRSGGISVAETGRFLYLCGLVFGGILVILLPFVAYYFYRGAFSDLMLGIFVRPSHRVAGASFPFPGIRGALCGLILPLLLALGCLFNGKKIDRAIAWVLGVSLASVLIFSGNPTLNKVIFFSVRAAAPPLILLSFIFITFKKSGRSPDLAHRLFLATMCLSVASLIQFPDAYVIYFFYMTPFLWIFLSAFGGLSLTWPKSFSVLSGFLLLYPVIVLHGSDRVRYVPLGLPKASLIVPEADEKIYFPLVKRIQSLSKQGDYIFAGPDCPEIYFLSERANPTKIFYELLEKKEGLEAEVLSILHEKHCPMVVINLRPGYSPSYSKSFMDELAHRYKKAEIFAWFVLFHDLTPGGN